MTGISCATRGRLRRGRLIRTRAVRGALLAMATACLCLPPVSGQAQTPGEPATLPAAPVAAPLAAATPTDDGQPSPNRDVSVSSIEVEGNETIPKSAIMKHIKTQVNRQASPETIREDVRSLYATRWFFSVEPRFRQTDNGMALVFKVFERPTVRSVEYRGNQKIKTEYLKALTNLKPGSPFDISANKEAAHRIEDTYHERGHAFATVELEKGADPDDRDIIFLIEEGPKVIVSRVRFIGNEFFSSALLRTKLRTKTILPGLGWLGVTWLGGKYDPATIPDDIASLKQYYQQLGFFDVDLTKQLLFNDNRSRVEVQYTITEGQRYVVQNILIEGNRVLAEEDLRSEFKLAAGDHFNARYLNQDLLRVRSKYGQQGRLFATVEAVPRFLETPAKVDVVYRIDEDRVRRIRRLNVHFGGDHPHTKETVVHNRSLIRPGDLANSRLIERTKRRLEGTQLFERGPRQGVRININPIDVPITSTGGGQSANGDVVRGQDAAVSRLFAEHPPATSVAQQAIQPITHSTARPAGQASGQRVIRSAPRPGTNTGNSDTVYRSQSDGDVFAPNNPLFGNSPQGNPLINRFREPPPGWVDLDIYLNETRTGRLMFGVGVNSDAGMVGSIVLDESNFDILRPPTSWSDVLHGHAWRGGGQRFRLEAIPGNVVSRYLVSWTDPYFLDTDFSLRTSAFYFNRFYPDWDEDRTGGQFGLGKQITNEISINGSLRLENVELKNPDIPTPSIVQDSLGSSTLSTFKIAAAHDSRDSAFLPSEGHLAQVSYEQAFGDFSYPRVEGELRQYFSVFTRPDGGGRHVLSVGAEMGWTGDDTPVYERFFAGGFQTFRGFRYRGVSPREFDTSIGGQWLFVGSAEYKLPVTADDMISLVFFSDFGTVEEEVDFDAFRVTVGAGLRVTIPAMGPVPLAFDFAFPLAKQDFDDTQVFSFYVGINR